MELLSTILKEQSNYFQKDLESYPSLEFRIEKLKALASFLSENESQLIECLRMDLDRPPFECLVGEILPVHQEIQKAIRSLKTWMKPQKCKGPMGRVAHWQSKAEVFPQPRGTSLILGPWNYPIQLILNPLVSSIAAGNCSIVKASEWSVHTSQFLSDSLNKIYPRSYIYFVEGGAETAQYLLNQKFDFIFFTGSTDVGRKVMAAASKHLTPVVLELGGKCPVIIDREQKDLRTSLRRILWGKMFNAGQTCVAPDHVLIPEEVFQDSVEILKSLISEHFSSPESYSRIINERHFQRLKSLTKDSQIIFEGDSDHQKLKLGPILAEIKDLEDALMREEIFGPILPLKSYSNEDEVFQWIGGLSKPLAIYLFSKNKSLIQKFRSQTQSGALVVNDVLIHLTHPELPFGGVGESGFGSYHGYYGFQAFSHWKAVEQSRLWPDFSLRYPPYSSKIPNFWRRFL